MIPSDDAFSAIFQPSIITSHTTMLETDYNIHKSNSTYFSDLDVGRMHHIACMMKLGLHKARDQIVSEKKGQFGVVLGGVTCSFKKELKPYETFEIWTRVLAWDKKWLYTASHIVKKGATKPSRYLVQPWKKTGRGLMLDQAEGEKKNPTIYATSMSKYVFKQGRVTVSPEKILQLAGLIPERPLNHGSTLQTLHQGANDQSTSINGNATVPAESRPILEIGSTVHASLKPVNTVIWDWDTIETERTKGMIIAAHMAALDGLQDDFTGESRPVLGQF
jgi:acyl-CoA thioesterase FadM